MRPDKILGGASNVTSSKEELERRLHAKCAPRRTSPGLFTGNESAHDKIINAFIDGALIWVPVES